MQQAESYTVEEVKARVLSKAIVIRISSKQVEDGKDEFGKIRFKPIVETVSVARESDMKPEIVRSGPKQYGEVNMYIGTDARKHYFDAKTGVALGSQLGPKNKTLNPMKLIPPSKSDPAPRGTDQRYVR